VVRGSPSSSLADLVGVLISLSHGVDRVVPQCHAIANSVVQLSSLKSAILLLMNRGSSHSSFLER
jgi:hypothetical protein